MARGRLPRTRQQHRRAFDSNTRRSGSKPCTETQSGMSTLGHRSLERHGLGPMATDAEHVSSMQAQETVKGKR